MARTPEKVVDLEYNEFVKIREEIARNIKKKCIEKYFEGK